MKVKRMGKETDYPLTYKQYEEKICELFLEEYEGEELERMIDRLDAELKEEPNIIQTFYGQDCFHYDNPQIYGEITKKTFEDDFLKRDTVSNLRWILEGE
jgi:hypothetical protein